ncbi:hypothetical protein OE88DRAFT_1662514 [Heliocybe sulcata]|uniref:Uncharacterized protein n=1 Tax=Heliocybe sulcata TaxID=5364 RepID=A0A5C3MWC5_9AGAM|nr:hypothetical protein OE88DRAFT_1662514 [Heliocybe sulcata]
MYFTSFCYLPLPLLLLMLVPGNIQEHIAEERLIEQHDILVKDMETFRADKAFSVLIIARALRRSC